MSERQSRPHRARFSRQSAEAHIRGLIEQLEERQKRMTGQTIIAFGWGI